MKSSMNIKASQKGFTLIELVVVIVILGILAVTAAPKFIDLTSDAKASTIEAVKGALNSAADMAHAKALVAGVTSGSLSIAGQSIQFENSYPDAASILKLMDINATLSGAAGDAGDFIYETAAAGSAGDGTGVTSYTHPTAVDSAACVATYDETDDANVKPSITSISTDC